MTNPQPDYSIAVDPDRRFVKITLSGFWDAGLLARYQADVRKLAQAAAASAKPGDQPSRVLLDMREHTLLSKELASTLQEGLPAGGPDDRMAVVVDKDGMLKHQVRRVASARGPQFFNTELEALAWLFEEGAR